MHNLWRDGGRTLPSELYNKIENKVWYRGSVAELIQFYKNNNEFTVNRGVQKHQFWKIVGANSIYRLALDHYDLPAMITRAMTTLTFHESPMISLSNGNESLSNTFTNTLNEIYDDNNGDVLFQEAASMMSYSGAVAFKIVKDVNFDYPIVIPYAKEDFDVVKTYNRVTEIQFKDDYVDNNKNYVLRSYYGKGYITYKLFSLDYQYGEKEVPLNTIEATAGLRPVYLDNNLMLAVYVENRLDARSDYDGIIDELQALDEAYSNLNNFVRKSKIKTYLPESMMQRDSDGRLVLPNEYDTDNVILYDQTNSDNYKNEIIRDVPNMNESTQSYINVIDLHIQSICRTVGLSATTLGFPEASANSSGIALENRETPTFRTRAERNKRWTKAINDLSKILLTVHYAQISTSILPVAIDEPNTDISLRLPSFDEFEFNCAFAEYTKPTLDARGQTLITLLEGGLISREEAVKQLWEETKSEEEIEEMLEAIEAERYLNDYNDDRDEDDTNISDDDSNEDKDDLNDSDKE